MANRNSINTGRQIVLHIDDTGRTTSKGGAPPHTDAEVEGFLGPKNPGATIDAQGGGNFGNINRVPTPP